MNRNDSAQAYDEAAPEVVEAIELQVRKRRGRRPHLVVVAEPIVAPAPSTPHPTPHQLVARRALEILSDSSLWTQGAAARDRHGNATDPEGPFAVTWDLMGACRKALFEQKRDHFKEVMAFKMELTRAITERHDDFGPLAFNDNMNTTYEMVVAALKEIA